MKSKNLNNEEKLVKRLRKGNIDAFELLYKSYSLRLYHFGLKYLKSEVQAEEMVQEVFLKVWEKRSSLKAELSFKSYIFTIAYNIIRKIFIKRSQRSEYLQKKRALEQIDQDTNNQIEYKSLLEYLHTIIDQLPEKRREIFKKSRIDDISVKEIASQLGISHKTVENQLTLALKFIRSKLKSNNSSALLILAIFL